MTPEGAARTLGALASVTLVRGALVFVLAAAAATLAGRLRPEVRRLACLVVLASFLLVPVAWLVLPGIPVGPLIPRGPASNMGVAAASALSRAEFARLVERTVADTSRALRPHQPPAAAICLGLLSAWAAGALLLGARVAPAAARIRGLAAAARLEPGMQRAAERVGRGAGLRRRFRVLLSPRCRIPFTFGLRAPAVVLPSAACGWPRGRLEAVLTHELAHIRRRDVLVHTLAYCVCILFWFFPPAWLAYAALLRETETCCDQAVIDRGARTGAYAQVILDTVRDSGGRAILPAVSAALAGPRMIRERISRVLSLRKGSRPFRTRAAAAVVAVLLCCLAPVITVFAGADGSGLPPGDPYFGTWVNADYEGVRGTYPARAVLSPDGHLLEYRGLADGDPSGEGWHSVERTWVAAGVRWYRARTVSRQSPGGAGKVEGYCLTRISADGATRETVWAQYGYPETVSSLGSRYRIMYREE